jgi:CRP-like cAMP-binding protein
MQATVSEIRKFNFFSSLPDATLQALAERIQVVQYQPDSWVIREGEGGTHFYFVKEGRLEVMKKGRSGNNVHLSTIGSGSSFGEISLMTYAPRSTSVRATNDVFLWVLPKNGFEELLTSDSGLRHNVLQHVHSCLRYNGIKTLQPFELLEQEKVVVAMERMTEENFMPGEDIIVQGERGDKYYIIKSGRVAVLKNKKGDAAVSKVIELQPGDAFGEEALIREDPRNATCRVMEETTVFALNKADFNQIIRSPFLDSIFPEEIELDSYQDDYTIIDARVPSEYEEEHISGAVNIPLEVLREQSCTFDPEKNYITCCLHDSRGMVAAFLLKNRGLKAQCLRGGVSGWMGEVASGKGEQG